MNATLKRRLWLLLRVCVAGGIVAYLLSVISIHQVLESLRSVPIGVLAGALATMYAGLALAALRWRSLYAATETAGAPSLVALFRLHLEGIFYNVYVPGGASGDFLRAVATRNVGDNGLTGALSIVFVERLLGLLALVLLVAASSGAYPLPRLGDAFVWSGLGFALVIAAIGAIAVGRRYAASLPGPLRAIASRLPALRRRAPLFIAVLLSLGTHTANVLVGHALTASLADVALAQSFVIMPLISLTAFFPLTVGGVGVREGAFVLLYGLVGVPQSAALAASFAFFGCQLVFAGSGGLLHVVRPLIGGAQTLPT